MTGKLSISSVKRRIMQEFEYKDFSWQTHKKFQELRQPTSCQFELTFGCGLHCRHCYSDCYNQPEFLSRELNTAEVKRLITKIRKQGVFWLCFTGGDPLTRKDFSEIYAFARLKGFLVSVFTSGYSLDKQILEMFKRQPPFVVELTLNAVRESIYERISGVKGSFHKVMEAISVLRQEKIPLKIKTQITRDNLGHIGKIQEFLKRQGLVFRPDFHLFARLNGDSLPCELRVTPAELFNTLGIRLKGNGACQEAVSLKIKGNESFHCAVGSGDGFRIDPYGRLFLCPAIRNHSVNVLPGSMNSAFKKSLAFVAAKG